MGWWLAQIGEPYWLGMSAVSSTSFTPMGMPCSGPGLALAAAARAWAGSKWVKARTAGSRLRDVIQVGVDQRLRAQLAVVDQAHCLGCGQADEIRSTYPSLRFDAPQHRTHIALPFRPEASRLKPAEQRDGPHSDVRLRCRRWHGRYAIGTETSCCDTVYRRASDER